MSYFQFQRLDTKLLQGQMGLHAKVVTATRQRPTTVWASTSATGMCLNAVLLKFSTNEDHQATLQGRKGLAGTKMGLDEDLTPAQ
jgi:hypothetical protein